MSIIIEHLLSNLVLYVLFWVAFSRQERAARLLARQVSIMNLLVVGLQKELMVHDLTVSGVNPSTGATGDERVELAIHKHEQVLAVMDSIRSMIEEIDTSRRNSGF